MSIGILTLLMVIVRLIVRQRLPKPAHVTAGNVFFDWIGKVCPLCTVPVGLFDGRSADSRSPVQVGLAPIVFGGSGAPLPADFSDFAARVLHGFIAPAAVPAHPPACWRRFYHQLALKDNLLARMWYGK